jgi:hypothetical protein
MVAARMREMVDTTVCKIPKEVCPETCRAGRKQTRPDDLSRRVRVEGIVSWPMLQQPHLIP